MKKLLIISLFIAPTVAMAQTADKTVSGTVTDAATGQPLAGVYVQAYGNSRFSAMTDENGQYQIKVPEYTTSLSMRIDGYQLLQKSIAGETTDARMYSVAFSPVYQRTTTATLSRQAEDFDNTAEQSIDPLISQRLGADVLTIGRSANPAEGNVMLMAGLNSLQANAQPLVVIDGVITDMQYDRTMLHDGYYNNLLANLNVNDIERVTVLKNGTALYGAKGAAGVLLIETKRNKSMATKIDVTINGSYQLMPRTPKMMGAEDYRLYATELLANQTANVGKLGFVNSDPTYYYYNKYHNDTDWKDEVYHNAFTQNYGINVQGGDDVASYNLSVGYSLANSTLRDNSYSRFNMRLNTDIEIFRSLKTRFDASYSDVNRNLRDDGAPAPGSPVVASPNFLALVKSPFLSPYAYDLNGHLSNYLAEADDYLEQVYGTDASLANPTAILEYGDGDNRNQFGNRMISFSITPRYEFSKSLALSEHFNFSLVNTNENYYLPMGGVPQFKVEGLGQNYMSNLAQSMAARQTSIQSDTRLSWNKRFNAHGITVYGGMRFQSMNYKLTSQRGYNTGNDKTPNMSTSLQYKSTDGADDKSRSITWYAMADYNMAEKYYVTAGLSAEASSRFGDDADGLKLFNTVWGLFPSVQAAWVLTNEPWLARVKGVDYLRLNVGFDISGNDNIDYTASRTYFVANRMMGSGGGASDGVGGKSIGNIGNTSLKWETTSRLTAALEGNFIDNRLNLHVGYFRSWTRDLLTLHRLAWTSGLEQNWSNDGKLENKGFDAGFGVKVLALKDLSWEVGASAGHYKNEVTALPDGKSLETNLYGATILTEVGQPVGVFYGYKTEGVFTTQAQADQAALYQVNERGQREYFAAGDMHFADLDGNHVIDEADRTVIGDPNPDIYGNIYTRLAWKQWTLNATMNYSLGADVYNYQRSLIEGGSQFYNQTTAMNSRWTTEGQQTDIPRVSYGDPMGNARFSDRWIEDGSYLRLANVTLAYELPIQSTYLQGITVWGSAQNLFTLTRYLGGDPDCALSGSVLAQGIDRGLLARGRSFSLGIKINL
jgi:TonB-linked SusC/RagA family outer membrane protein